MCGIAGILEKSPATRPEDLSRICGAMADAAHHRGPDDHGVWIDAAAGIALGHRRLSVIDLSPAGHQPMASSSGRTVISYNGEIYNFAELRRDLQSAGVSFRGASDTEVLVEACEHWGLEDTLARLIGMFAFALWDRDRRRLTLARDRLGIKPLYWGETGGTLLFGSELKSLRAHPAFSAPLDMQALAGYLRFGYVPTPLSIFQGIRKLRPGTFLHISAGDDPREYASEEHVYWDAADAVRSGLNDPLDLDDDAAADALEDLLSKAVGQRMIADVPLGAFLSGGIDSSAVAALMQAQSSRPVKTFSIGFREKEFDEAIHAKAVARHLGTDHTELYLDSGHAREVIPRLPQIYDEPFADSSQIPTYLVSEMTRRHVTVSLSGDGGDELFAGYNRHVFAQGAWNRIAKTPSWMRTIGAWAVNRLSPDAWSRLGRHVPGNRVPPQLGHKLHKLADVLALPPQEIYRGLISQWHHPPLKAPDIAFDTGPLFDHASWSVAPDFLGQMQYLDTVTYLPDDILSKVDRASMAVSLEARVPLIDHRVVEFAWRLPAHMKIRDGRSKWLLRHVLARHVPNSLFERPKMGFGVPIGDWLRGPLRDWAEDLLSRDRLTSDGLFDADRIRHSWQQHLSGQQDCQHPLWVILMFQAWRDEHRAAPH